MIPTRKAACGVRNRGFTLVEVMVVLAVLALMTGLVTVGLATLEPSPESEYARSVERARAQAIRTGSPVRAAEPLPSLAVPHRPLPPLFLPDGRALGPGVDPLTGRPRAEP